VPPDHLELPRQGHRLVVGVGRRAGAEPAGQLDHPPQEPIVDPVDHVDPLDHQAGLAAASCPTLVLSDKIGAVRIQFAQSARRHRIGRARARHVIANPVVESTVPGEDGQEERLIYLGDDATDRALEVMTIPIEGGILVIHVMDLRPKWRQRYEEGKR
jgi:hypothetical protein